MENWEIDLRDSLDKAVRENVRMKGTLSAIASFMGNVDHSKGGGENAARLYGGMLMDIKAMALGALDGPSREGE